MEINGQLASQWASVFLLKIIAGAFFLFLLGFETLDVGGLSQALHLEHMTLLWVKMVRAGGHHPNFTWAYLER